ncbi:MAG: hypothetical protein UX62_C0003G0001, partial [Microgenomates group bacterium GW2011_GWA2_46_7]
LLPNQPTNHYSRLLKRGHFYVAEKRTFLFGIDSVAQGLLAQGLYVSSKTNPNSKMFEYEMDYYIKIYQSPIFLIYRR